MRVTYLDGAGAWRRGRVHVDEHGRIALRGDARADAECPAGGDAPRGSAPRERGEDELAGAVVTGAFTDWHVHLHLIDPRGLRGGAIGRVVDLGGSPGALARISSSAPSAPSAPSALSAPSGTATPLEVRFAGAFLTPSGGYPSDRDWAPSSAYREIGDPEAAARAVAEMAAHGARFIKVASNRSTGPVFEDALFRCIVAEAAEAGLQVVAHAEGPGEALRTARLGARYLAHTPFTERLTDAEIDELAVGTTWISTLDIHGWGTPTAEQGVALDNLARFRLRGGRVRYGTDMGNGPTPVGLNPRELAALAAAGLPPAEQLAALTPADPLTTPGALLLVPGDAPDTLDLASARPIRIEDLAPEEEPV